MSTTPTPQDLQARYDALRHAVRRWADADEPYGPECLDMLALAGVPGFVPPDRAARETLTETTP
jgi:hypothetical protein